MPHAIDGDLPQKDRIFLLILLLLPCLFIHLKFDSDTYWLINSGRYVLAHGIPHIEPFTLHQGMHFVMQQWLSATLFAWIYNTLGSSLLFVLVAVINACIIFSIFRFCMRISNGNFLVSFTMAFCISVPLRIFMVIRPFLFSTLLFSIELNLLEAFIQKMKPQAVQTICPDLDAADPPLISKTSSESFRKGILLCWLPVLSAVLINIHAALWPFFFVLLVPYVIDSFRFNLWGVKGQGYPLLPIAVAAGLSLAAGWLNPYGFESMSYLYRSYGNPYLSGMISEMKSPDFKTLPGILVFTIYLCGILTYCFNCNGKTRLRYALLAIGTGYMGLSSFRSISLFLVAGLPVLAFTARSAKVLAAAGGESKYPWLRHVLATALVLWTGWSFYTRAGESEKKAELFLPVQAVEYIKTHLDKDRIHLFTGFNTGGYAEFQGLRPFIDARAEIFMKSNNRKADILDDYFDVLIGKKHYRELIERYKLTHFLVGKSDMLFDVYLSKDPDVELLFSDNDFKVFGMK